jgi:hypothetical protein
MGSDLLLLHGVSGDTLFPECVEGHMVALFIVKLIDNPHEVVLLNVLANTRELKLDIDLCLLEDVGATNTRQFEELRALDGSVKQRSEYGCSSHSRATYPAAKMTSFEARMVLVSPPWVYSTPAAIRLPSLSFSSDQITREA